MMPVIDESRVGSKVSVMRNTMMNVFCLIVRSKSGKLYGVLTQSVPGRIHSIVIGTFDEVSSAT